MAVHMNQKNLSDILVKLFGGFSQAEEKLKMMVSAGASAAFGLFNFQIKYSDTQVFTCKLPVLSTTIVGLSNPTQLQLIAQAVSKTIDSAFLAYPAFLAAAKVEAVEPEATTAPYVYHGSTTASTELPSYLKAGMSAKEKAAVKKAQEPAPVPATTAGFEPLVVPTVIPLKDSRGVGQKVKGTGGGSVYRCYAVGEVNMAVKLGPGQASIRVEGKHGIPDKVRKALTEAGFSDHSGYMSMHVTLNNVPPMRVLGAVAFCLDIPFNQIATSLELING